MKVAKFALLLACGIGIIGLGVISIFYRFLNPQLTNTQLFLAGWPLGILAALLMLVFRWVYNRIE